MNESSDANLHESDQFISEDQTKSIVLPKSEIDKEQIKKTDKVSTDRTEWVGNESSQTGTKLSKKEITFSGSNKKA